MSRVAGSVALAVVLASSSCSSPVRAGSLAISSPLVGEAPLGADAAVYFDVVADGDDAIVGVSTAAAEGAILHEMRPVEGGGIMVTSEVLDIEPGITRLEPLGSHLMLSNLRRPLVAGDTVTLVLSFEHHPDIDVAVPVVPLYQLAEIVGDGGDLQGGGRG